MSVDLKNVLSSLGSTADWVGLRYVEEDSRTVYVRDEKLEQNHQTKDSGVMVEVLKDGQFGYAATSNMDPENLKATYEKALDLVEKSKKWDLFPFTKDQRPKATGNYTSKIDREFDRAALEELTSTLIECTRKMKAPEEVLSRIAYGMHSRTKTHFVSSNGSNFTQDLSQNFTNQSITAQKDGDVQTRSNGMEVGQMGFEFFNRDEIVQGAEQLSKQVSELLNAENCPTGEMDLLLAPSQLYLQIHESIGHPLELDRILGDERNYAGWSFINPDDFGKLQYGSPLLNVTFDPTLETEMASYKFDDTGAEAKKEYIIKDGVLQRGLGSLESQVRSKIPGVACARATSWNRPPLDRMANLNIEPGDSSVDEMVASIEKGILMDTNKSWSIDDYRNKFQFGCEYGKLIENGKVTKTVKNPNYRGICTPFWNNLKAVGNADNFEVWGSFYCGKAEPNQIIRVGHATPYCLFSNVEVFGGVQ